MKKILWMIALTAAVMTGCKLEEAEISGDVCSPSLTAGSGLKIGDIMCYADHMEGDCIDDNGVCIAISACSECPKAYRECARYQRDFDKLVENAESEMRKYVSFVDGDDDLSPYASLLVSGNLNRCPLQSPHCVWRETDGEFEFGCITCSESICGTECVDLDSSERHCGACDNACVRGAVCEEGECVCGDGEIICEEGCIDPDTDVRHCGAAGSCTGDEAGKICESNEICSSGRCMRNDTELECEEGKHPYYTAQISMCEDDSLEHCGEHNKQCAVQGWVSGSCTGGVCTAEKCGIGYHRSEAGSCEPDSHECCGDACEQCPEDMMCSLGRCSSECTDPMTECQNPNGMRYCAKLDTAMMDCGGCGNACRIDVVPDSLDVICRDSVCTALECAEGFHLYEGTCEADSVENCGAHAAACNVANADNQCVDAKCGHVCKVDTHPVGDACVPDSVSECGSVDKVCTALPGWQDGKCIGTVCAAESCQPAYHLDAAAKTCVEDTDVCCGAGCVKCGERMLCSGGTCIYDCKPEETVCKSGGIVTCADLSSNINHCGACSQRCTTAQHPNSAQVACSGAQCVLVSCKNGYHLYNGMCEQDSVSSCGTHGAVCGVANASNSCSGGKCTFSCNAGYHRYGGGCEADDIYNCGSHGNVCPGKHNGHPVCAGGACSTQCNSNAHDDSGLCELNDRDNCGAHGKACYATKESNATDTKCTAEGKCVALGCDEGFNLTDGQCQPNHSILCSGNKKVKFCSLTWYRTSICCVKCPDQNCMEVDYLN